MEAVGVFIECFKNNGIPYLRVSEVFRIHEGAHSKCRRWVVRNIGPLARFDDGKPDYLSRLRASFAAGTPLIESLQDLVDGQPQRKRLVVAFDLDNSDNCYCDPKNIGYFLLDGLYDALGLYDVLNKHKSQTKITYDLNGLARLLVFGRVLWPDSKLGTFQGRDRYAFDVINSEHPIEAYRVLDVLHEKSETIQTRMNYKIAQSVGRNLEVCYYDVTNYYFEIEQNDEDILDKNGNVLREGLRKKGPSKEKRGEPIVQMGLFIDDQGIPIAYRLFPGNHIDQTTLRPALKKSIDRLKFGRVIIVADGGLNSDKNIAHILAEENGYILSRSTKKSARTVRDWMLEEEGYAWNESRTFKVKSKIRQRTIKDEDGISHEITEKLVCYWSKKHYDREVRENAKFLGYLDSVIANPDKLKDKPRKVEQFLKKMEVDPQTGEILETKTRLTLDLDKLQAYKDLLGYYTIMSSEIDKSDREIIDKYHGLSRIEDSFRITKSDLEARPVFLKNQDHINAHFLICFIALTMIRLIQCRILKYLGKDKMDEDGWESGLSADQIRKALQDYQADALPGGHYRLTKPSEDLQLILHALGIDGDLRLPTHSELRRLKHSFDKATVM